MLIKRTIYPEVRFLPNKRCRTFMRCQVEYTTTVRVKETSESDFPLAFVTHRIDETTPIREYKGQLYEPLTEYKGNDPETGKRIDTQATAEEFAKERSEEYRPYRGIADVNSQYEDILICNGLVWKCCDEPAYEVNTFGADDVAVMLDTVNEVDSSGRKFRADQYAEAVAEARSLGRRNGDKIPDDMTENGWYIEVMKPDAIKSDPQKAYRERTIRETAGEIMKLIDEASEKLDGLNKFNGTPGILTLKDAIKCDANGLVNILAGAASVKAS